MIGLRNCSVWRFRSRNTLVHKDIDAYRKQQAADDNERYFGKTGSAEIWKTSTRNTTWPAVIQHSVLLLMQRDTLEQFPPYSVRTVTTDRSNMATIGQNWTFRSGRMT